MLVWILDSVALIDWYCGRRGVAPYLARIISGEERGGFSTMSEVELWQGLRPGEEERHEAIFSLLERIPVDGAIARRVGQLRRQFGLERLSLPDAVIAAKPGSKRLGHATLASAHRRGEAFARQALHGSGLYGANASPLPARVRTVSQCPAFRLSAALTGYRLLTRNTHDFEALRSLIVVEFYSNR
jgi:predicted nucleic acid-binding protein